MTFNPYYERGGSVGITPFISAFYDSTVVEGSREVCQSKHVLVYAFARAWCRTGTRCIGVNAVGFGYHHWGQRLVLQCQVRCPDICFSHMAFACDVP